MSLDRVSARVREWGRRLADGPALWLVLLLCLGGWILPQSSIDYRRARWEEPESLLFLPTGEYLDVVSLGHQNLVADALYLWSIQYYGHHRSAVGRQYLWRIYDVITDLDPRFQDAYLTGALVMAVDMGDPRLALQLLEKAAEHNPDQWIYPLEAGYYAWMSIGDLDLAAEYFLRAEAIAGSPATVPRIRAGLAEYSGRAEDALEMWIGIYEQAERDRDEKIQSIAWQHVYDLRVDLDLAAMRQAIDAFRDRNGRPPRALGALVRQGYLNRLPTTPDGSDYFYDPLRGIVDDPREGSSRANR